MKIWPSICTDLLISNEKFCENYFKTNFSEKYIFVNGEQVMCSTFKTTTYPDFLEIDLILLNHLHLSIYKRSKADRKTRDNGSAKPIL
jgi:hypothetical protein